MSTATSDEDVSLTDAIGVSFFAVVARLSLCVGVALLTLSARALARAVECASGLFVDTEIPAALPVTPAQTPAAVPPDPVVVIDGERYERRAEGLFPHWWTQRDISSYETRRRCAGSRLPARPRSTRERELHYA